METIKINKLDQIGTMLIVGIEGKEDHTMQTGWQAKEVDYFMKNVLVGGSVSCTLYDKPDKNNPAKIYKNIKDVDFSSAVKDINQPDHPSMNMGNTRENPEPQSVKASDPKHDSIVAQVILKGAVEIVCKATRPVISLKENETSTNQIPLLCNANSEILGEYLCMAVNQLTGAYALALSNVKAL